MFGRCVCLLVFLGSLSWGWAEEAKQRRVFDLRKLDPVFKKGLGEALDAYYKKFPQAKVASLGFYFSHQAGSFEIMAHGDENDLPEDCLEFEPGYVGAVELINLKGFDYQTFYFGEEDNDGTAIPEDVVFINAEGKQIRLKGEEWGDEDFNAVILRHVKGLLVNYFAKRPTETPRSVVIQAVAGDPFFLGPLDGDGKSVPGFIKMPQPPALLSLKGKQPPALKLGRLTLYEVVLPYIHKGLYFREGETSKYENFRKIGTRPVAKWWRPLTMKLQKGKTRLGHVVRFPAKGWFAVNPIALQSAPFRKVLEGSGELMPVTVGGEGWQLFHCTKLADPEMVDEVLSGERDWGRVKTWAVRPEHLPVKDNVFVFKRKDYSIPRLFTTSLSSRVSELK